MFAESEPDQVWTAHRLRLAGETFRAMQAMSRRKKIKPFVARAVGSGDEAIEFVNGSRILFAPVNVGSGLGSLAWTWLCWMRRNA